MSAIAHMSEGTDRVKLEGRKAGFWCSAQRPENVGAMMITISTMSRGGGHPSLEITYQKLLLQFEHPL